MNYDVSIKLVVIGESGVGKSNLILRFKENWFDD
jgi:GTPase SAR1 family protein